MADIISIRSHPSWGCEPLPRVRTDDAAIIMFPGVRYERAAETPVENSGTGGMRTDGRGKQKTQA